MRLPETFNFETMDKAAMVRVFALAALIIAILIGCLKILAPFTPAILLAIIFTLSTWPAFTWLERKLNHRTTLAAVLMTVMIAIGFLVPVILIANSLTGNFSKLWTTMVATVESSDGEPPAWIHELPFVSDYALSFWEKYFSDMQTLSDTLKNNAAVIYQKLLKAGAMLGRGVADISLGVFITYFLFRHGVQTAERLRALIDKFVGTFGQHLLEVSHRTIISVIYGTVGTAVAQGTLAAIGFSIAGVPGAVFLGLMTFFFSFIPFGPPFIWVPATIWLLSEYHIGAGVFMGIWGLCAISMADNVIRPYFIFLGSDLPLLLVLLGVLGGILAFGFIGLFIGPVLLALAYTMILTWSNKDAVIAEVAAETESDRAHDV